MDIRFDKVVVDKSIDSISLTVAGAHHGNELAGRLIALNDGASSGANQK